MSGLQAPATLLVRAVRDASRGIARDLGELENLQSAPESASRYAEAGRERAREMLRANLTAAAPGYGWRDDREEEAGRDPRRRWVVEPLSGMACFRRGAPGAALLAAYQDRGATRAVAVLDPATGELYTARHGEGAFRGQHRLRVSARTRPGDCLVSTAAATPADRARVEASGATPHGAGSPALDMAWLAAGRLDAVVLRDGGPVAIAAPLLVQEAGGRVAQLPGERPESTLTVASAPGLGDALLALLAS